jgi:hypothetical protein
MEHQQLLSSMCPLIRNILRDRGDERRDLVFTRNIISKAIHEATGAISSSNTWGCVGSPNHASL